MTKMDAKKVGLVFGCFLALFHLVWSIAILITQSGVQWFMDWILGLHRIALGFQILPFHLMSAVLLVVVTFVVGYIIGYAFAAIWNWQVKK